MKKNNSLEFTLIKKIKSQMKINDESLIKGIGDDAAVVKKDKNTYFLYTCDSLVSGVHFLEAYSSPYAIGRKATAVNLSDIAAMGGTPKYMLVSLFIQKGITQKFIDELYKGLNKECKKYDVDIIGGNISKSDQFIIDIFLVGEVNSKNLLLRSGAKAGDVILVTGTLGDSATGLNLLQNRENFSKKFISRHLTPNARVKEGILLGESELVTSMIDVSDGLSSDIQHICDESKVGVKLFLEKLPVSNGVGKITALNGGEDYELCFTTSPKNIPYLSKLFKTKITVIGEIISSKKGRWLIDEKGNKRKLITKGWDHFSK